MNREEIGAVVYEGALLLDQEDFKGFLRTCAPDFSYQITAFSPEIGKDMVWLKHDRQGMQGLFAMLPQHVRMKGRFKRHISIYRIGNEDGCARVLSSVLLIHTDIEGTSTLFAAGQYEDIIDVSGPTPLLTSREVRLETRSLGPGMHIPV
ncbi:aromatic-ring-hydroxylating dioxygenase subunit beta [Lacisediminimonas profundi]|uniref:aromatic-ring-hydroxylating dioxygenase subunit beta n=1 Tax=Lacisediminimonas profundi TaxID=2603856 RepID=UPI00124B14FB|nr:aromatic-ring-hydroxylating dioxygenase subunit beta [Lacisediminimonas profundi]